MKFRDILNEISTFRGYRGPHPAVQEELELRDKLLKKFVDKLEMYGGPRGIKIFNLKNLEDFYDVDEGNIYNITNFNEVMDIVNNFVNENKKSVSLNSSGRMCIIDFGNRVTLTLEKFKF